MLKFCISAPIRSARILLLPAWAFKVWVDARRLTVRKRGRVLVPTWQEKDKNVDHTLSKLKNGKLDS